MQQNDQTVAAARSVGDRAGWQRILLQGVLVLGEVPGHLQSPDGVPVSQVLNPEPCDELRTPPQGWILPLPYAAESATTG